MAYAPGQHGGEGGYGNQGRTPPSWDPASSNYSFRDWQADLRLWMEVTPLQAQQMGPAVALALGGLAKQMAKEIPIDTLRDGMVMDIGDGNGMVLHPGIPVRLRALARRFHPLNVEERIRAIMSMVAFRRQPGEQIDTFLDRFDLLRHRAQSIGSVNIGGTGFAWMILNALHIHPAQWALILSPTGGSLPANEDQLSEMIAFVKRQGHLFEGHL